MNSGSIRREALNMLFLIVATVLAILLAATIVSALHPVVAVPAIGTVSTFMAH